MIKSIKHTRFRGHEGNYTFGPGRNYIKGPNESGKSTIKEAIAFAWMGTDSSGTKAPDHLITVGNDEMEVWLTTVRSTIVRRKRRTGTSEIRLIKEGIPEPIKLTQTELMNQLGISYDLFMSSWAVGYFMALKPDTKLKVLGEVAKIDRKSLLFDILGPGVSLPSQVKLANPRIDSEAMAGLRRGEQNKRQALEMSLSRIKAQYATIPTEITDFDQLLADNMLAFLDAQLQEHSLYKQQLPRWKAENERRSKLGEEYKRIQAELEKLDADRTTHLNISNEVSKALDEYENRLAETSDQITKLRGDKKSVELEIPPKPNLKAGTCPLCGTEVAEDRVEAVMKPYLAEVEKYNKHARKVADHNKKIDEKLLELEKSFKNFEIKFNDAKTRFAVNQAHLKSTEASITKAKAAFDQVCNSPSDLMPAPKAPDSDERTLQEKRDALKQKIHAYQMFKNQKSVLEAELAQTEESIQAVTAQAEKYRVIEEALLQLPELETRTTLEKVAIPGIKMSLVDGELVVTNDEGVDYRCLSDGKRMKVDIALCLAIKKAEPKSPDWLFVDNADLMDEEVYVPEAVQVFIAQVDPEVKDVQVISL